MRVDFEVVRRMEAAARRHRAEALGTLIATAFAWLFSRSRETRVETLVTAAKR